MHYVWVKSLKCEQSQILASKTQISVKKLWTFIWERQCWLKSSTSMPNITTSSYAACQLPGSSVEEITWSFSRASYTRESWLENGREQLLIDWSDEMILNLILFNEGSDNEVNQEEEPMRFFRYVRWQWRWRLSLWRLSGAYKMFTLKLLSPIQLMSNIEKSAKRGWHFL